MADQTHSVTISNVNDQDTAIAHVPAEAQREERFVIDDEIEVTIEELGGLFNSISFVATQNAGDQITVPAEVVRRSGLEAGEKYDMSFERFEGDESDEESESEDLSEEEVEESNDSSASQDEDLGEYAVSDDEIEVDDETDADDILDEIESEFEEAEEEIEEEEAEEEEEKGLGSLFA